MKTILAFIKNNPVLSYFTLTFIISWGNVLLVLSQTGGIATTKEQLAAQLPIAIMLMILGPGLAGLVMTGLVDGRAGYRDLFSRLIKWRVNFIWYAIALLTAPLILLLILLMLSLFSPVYIPGIFTPDNRLLFGIASGLVVGILEELGWSGFAAPRLRRRYSILSTGLIVGVIWGAWHIIGQVVMASGTYTGELSLQFFLITSTVGLLIGQLPAFRIIMVWVYDRTGSLLLAMIMHTTYTAATIGLEPVAISGMPLQIYSWASTAVMWIIAIAVVLAGKTFTFDSVPVDSGILR